MLPPRLSARPNIITDISPMGVTKKQLSEFVISNLFCRHKPFSVFLYSSMVAYKDGHVYTYGDNYYGHLGLGDRKYIDQPTIVPEFNNKIIVNICKSWAATLVLCSDHTVYGFGANDFGDLCFSDKIKIRRPVEINELSNKCITQISFTRAHGLALSRNGLVYSWGHLGDGRLGINPYKLAETYDSLELPSSISTPMLIDTFNDPVVSIETGSFHSLALDTNHNVYIWGRVLDRSNSIPTKIDKLSDKKVVMISSGYQHNLALTSDGIVYSWGRNSNSQIGVGNYPTDIPVIVDSLLDKNIISICANKDYSLALSKTGDIYLWGIMLSPEMFSDSETIQYDRPTIISHISEEQVEVIQRSYDVDCFGSQHCRVTTNMENLFARDI